ncbi:hypothetical protein ANN_15802 [Periplaneta americana]|uniref:Uncharacterized protein n=1 Tax=Periplaneta americana TaxID=6978 RepID=A0ABQ8SH81_PERAM|nr:hypothetical protein ANN_15802 [Periplaneta americana]
MSSFVHLLGRDSTSIGSYVSPRRAHKTDSNAIIAFRSFCHHGELLRINRHNTVRSLIASSIRQNASYEVYEEVGCISSDGSTRRTDIIIIDRQKDKGVILDSTIRFEVHEQQLQEMCREKQVIYEPCCQHLGAQYHITHWTVFGLMFGARGTIPRETLNQLKQFNISDATIDAIGSHVLKSSIAIISNHLRISVDSVEVQKRNIDEPYVVHFCSKSPCQNATIANPMKRRAQKESIKLQTTQAERCRAYRDRKKAEPAQLGEPQPSSSTFLLATRQGTSCQHQRINKRIQQARVVIRFLLEAFAVYRGRADYWASKAATAGGGLEICQRRQCMNINELGSTQHRKSMQVHPTPPPHSAYLRNLSTPTKYYLENDERDSKRTRMTRRDRKDKCNEHSSS